MASPNRCLLSLIIFTIVVIGIIATVSLVMGFLIALYSPPNENNNGFSTGQDSDDGTVDMTGPTDGTNDTPMVSERDYEDQRIWMIHVGAYNHRVAYIDDETEQPRGLDVDITNAVCRLSRKRCRLVFDQYSNCFTENGIGRGFADNYYHACAGWVVSYERLKGAVFGTQYWRAPGTFWVTRLGNPSNFDPSDVTGSKIGFIRVWSSNVPCANKLTNIQGIPLSDNQVEMYDTIDQLLEDLNNGELDAGFISESIFDESRMLRVGDEASCTAGDVGIMASPTSAGLELVEWWNAGINRLLHSREYGEICDRLETIHGHKEGGRKQDICLTQYL
ncbi:uncharacterized protein [Amphiura filiformis]|uniref:uncharacterized protein isoform X1 n=1 Tax=Amphiura filiformis TaxID=82378 RepID=UPI003B217A32